MAPKLSARTIFRVATGEFPHSHEGKFSKSLCLAQVPLTYYTQVDLRNVHF